MWFKRRRKVVVNRIKVKSNPWVIRGIFLFILVLALGAAFYLLTASVFVVKSLEIKVEGDCVSRDKVRGVVQILGRNIFSVDKGDVETSIKKKFVCVKSVGLKKGLPDKVQLEVFNRVAVAQILTFPKKEASSSAILSEFLQVKASGSAEASRSAQVNPDKQYLVDEEGIVFSEGINPGVPTLQIWEEGLKLGEKLQQGVVTGALEILKQLSVLGLPTNDAKIYSDKILLVDTKPKVIFDLSVDKEKQLGALQLILTRAKIESREMEFVDLRFENPVVKYVPKKGEK